MFEKVILCPNCNAGMFSTTKARNVAHSLVTGERSLVLPKGRWTCGVCGSDFNQGTGFEAIIEDDFDLMAAAAELKL